MKNHFKSVDEIGEFGLIDRIQQILPQVEHPDVQLGIGDDTAVIRIDEQRSMLITCDIQVENQHFRMLHISPRQLGRRAMAVNLSDIAAMGGKPTFSLVSLGVPESFALDDFENLFKGMRDQLADFSAIVIGGNLSKTEKDLIIDITMMGEVDTGKYLTRSGAKADDRIYVTGQPGASGAGFRVLEKFGINYPPAYEPLVQKHLQPIPRIDVGKRIAQSGWATAMIDISDGIASDLNHICTMSKVGAEIHQARLLLPDKIDEVTALSGIPGIDLALYGGEDYELLFTIKSATPKSIIDSIAKDTGIAITEIGIIQPREFKCFLIDLAQNRIPVQPKGWDHFKGNEPAP